MRWRRWRRIRRATKVRDATRRLVSDDDARPTRPGLPPRPRLRRLRRRSGRLPHHQAILRQALADSAQPHRVDDFAAHHGFMFPERDVFDPAVAAAATDAMLTLFKTTLEATATT